MSTEGISISAIVNAEKTISYIVKAIKDNENSPELIQAGMEALFNIADSPDVADLIIDYGIIRIAFSALSRYDYNLKLLITTIRLLVVISNHGKALDQLCGASGERLIVLIQLMQATCVPVGEQTTNNKGASLVTQILKLLCNCFSLESNRIAMKNINGVTTILDIMQTYIENMETLSYCIAALSRLCPTPELSELVAEKACHQLIQLATLYIENTNVVSRVFELMGQLALVPANMKAIVQHGGVQLLIDTMKVFPENEELMISAISTLDNVIIVDEEYSNYVIEKGTYDPNHILLK
jgi:hypothetical protein